MIRRSFTLTLAMLLLAFAPAIAAAQTPTEPPPPDQTSDGGGIGFGVAIGMSKPSFRGSEDHGLFEPEGKNGVLGGVWLGGNRNGLLGVGAEVLYGVKTFDTIFGDLSQNYIEVTVPIRLNLGSRNRNGLIVYGVGGPVVDIKMASKLGDLDVEEDYQGFDAGLLAGAGIEFARLGVEVRGNWGLRAFYDPAEGSQDIKTFALQVLAKFRIN